MSKANILRLDSGQNCNWNGDAAPVAILNERSTLHDRLAYLHGLVDQMSSLANILAYHQQHEVKDVASALYWHIKPMAALLAHMAEETQHEGSL